MSDKDREVKETSVVQVKELRKSTGAGVTDCKQALEEAEGDLKAAVEVLRKKGLADLRKKSQRIASQGVIDSYIHAGGKIGVLVEVNSETDFVAQNDDFKEFVHNLAMHIAAANPSYISRDEVPKEILSKEKEIYAAQAKKEGKPEQVVEKITQGKLNQFYKTICLLEQPYVKDPDIIVEDYLGEVASKISENIVIRRFVRFQLGESSQ